MNSKKAKKAKKIARILANGKPPGEFDRIYKNMKETIRRAKS